MLALAFQKADWMRFFFFFWIPHVVFSQLFLVECSFSSLRESRIPTSSLLGAGLSSHTAAAGQTMLDLWWRMLAAQEKNNIDVLAHFLSWTFSLLGLDHSCLLLGNILPIFAYCGLVVEIPT